MWRGLVLLLFFAISFCKGWDWVFWPAFFLLVLTDPATYQKPQPVSPSLGRLLLVAYFLLMGTAVSVVAWEMINHTLVNQYWAVTLIVAGSLSMLIFGIRAVRYWNCNSQEKDL